MGGGKAVYWHENVGSGQLRLRIRINNPGNNR